MNTSLIPTDSANIEGRCYKDPHPPDELIARRVFLCDEQRGKSPNSHTPFTSDRKQFSQRFAFNGVLLGRAERERQAVH